MCFGSQAHSGNAIAGWHLQWHKTTVQKQARVSALQHAGETKCKPESMWAAATSQSLGAPLPKPSCQSLTVTTCLFSAVFSRTALLWQIGQKGYVCSQACKGIWEKLMRSSSLWKEIPVSEWVCEKFWALWFLQRDIKRTSCWTWGLISAIPFTSSGTLWTSELCFSEPTPWKPGSVSLNPSSRQRGKWLLGGEEWVVRRWNLSCVWGSVGFRHLGWGWDSERKIANVGGKPQKPPPPLYREGKQLSCGTGRGYLRE